MVISISDELEKRLQEAARARGLALEDYARVVLEDAAKKDRATLLAEIDRIRAMTPPGPKTDSGSLLEQARDERYGR